MKNKRFFLITVIDDFFTIYYLLINVYGILFFYEFFDRNIILTILPFAFVHLGFGLLVIPFTKYFGWLGTKAFLIISIFLTIATAIPMYIFGSNESVFLIYIWAIILIISKLFTHLPIIYSYSKYSTHSERGSQFAFQRINMILVTVFTPLIGGFVSENYGISGLFILAVASLFLAFIPISLLKNHKIVVNTDLKKLYRDKAVNKMLFMNYFRWWPILGGRFWVVYVFLFFSTSFEDIGFLITVTSAISIFLAYFLGRFMNGHNRNKSSKAFFAVDGLSWLVRSLGTMALSVPILDIFGRFTENLKEQAAAIVTFDWMTDEIDDLDEDDVILIRELHINVIISFLYIVLATIIYFFGFNAAFLVIGCAGILYSISKH